MSLADKVKKGYNKLKDNLELNIELIKFNLNISNTTKIAAGAAALFTANNMFAQGKTVTGYFENTQGKPWNGQVVELYEGDNLVGTDTLENGLMNVTDVVTDVKEEQNTQAQAQIKFYGTNHTLHIEGMNEKATATISDLLGKTRTINLKNNQLNLKGLSNGFYNIIIESDKKTYSRGLMLVDKNIFPSTKYTYTNKQVPRVNTMNKSGSRNDIQTDGYWMKVYGPKVMTKIISGLDFSGHTDVNLGNFIVEGKPIITGFVYDLDNKYDENNNRINPIPGLEGQKVYLGSNPNEFVFTNSKGLFKLMADTLKTDSIFVTNQDGDTTYYNWRRTIELAPDSQKINAFNDTTGIPVFKEWTDPENGVDYLEHLIFVTAIKRKWQQYPDTWFQTTPRVRDEDLPIKIYLNRENTPNEWYADSAWAGVKAMEEGRIKFIETTNQDSAIIKFTYKNFFSGETDLNYPFDNQGPYLRDVEIAIRGPPGGEAHSPEYMPHICAHEIMHVLYAGGEHSPYIQDMFYHAPNLRLSAGYPLKMTQREEKGVKLIYNLERNPKLLDYYK